MDQIEKTMLERINHPYKLMYWCEREEKWADPQECFHCREMDNDGHCDYQGPLEEVKQ